MSTDGTTYQNVGTIVGPSRQGVLTTNLSATADPDTTSVLGVNLSESNGTLTSGTQADADGGITLCYVDGELIGYEERNNRLYELKPRQIAQAHCRRRSPVLRFRQSSR